MLFFNVQWGIFKKCHKLLPSLCSTWHGLVITVFETDVCW